MVSGNSDMLREKREGLNAGCAEPHAPYRIDDSGIRVQE